MFLEKCVSLTGDAPGPFQTAKKVGIFGSTAPGRTMEALAANSWQDLEAVGFVGETRQSSKGPQPSLLYWPAMDTKLNEGREAFTGRGGGGGDGIDTNVCSLYPNKLNDHGK